MKPVFNVQVVVSHSSIDLETPCSCLRKTVAINNTVDLILPDDGTQLYLSSRSKNQFFDKRELLLDCKIHVPPSMLVSERLSTSKPFHSNQGSVLDQVNGVMVLRLWLQKKSISLFPHLFEDSEPFICHKMRKVLK